MAPRVYLAGPDVFYPDAQERGRRKQALCRAVGLQGVYPLDASLDLTGLAPAEAAMAIFQANLDLMRSCAGGLINMSPFRGPGMDGGTAFEMGVLQTLGRPMVGYSTGAPVYADRVEEFFRLTGTADGLTIEDFGLTDNLMMAAAVQQTGGVILCLSGSHQDEFDLFGDAARQLADRLKV